MYDPTTFLPLSTNIGGHVNTNRPKNDQYLTEEQEIEQDRELSRIDDTSGEINPYKELTAKKSRKDRTNFNTNGTVVYTEQYTQLYSI